MSWPEGTSPDIGMLKMPPYEGLCSGVLTHFAVGCALTYRSEPDQPEHISLRWPHSRRLLPNVLHGIAVFTPHMTVGRFDSVLFHVDLPVHQCDAPGQGGHVQYHYDGLYVDPTTGTSRLTLQCRLSPDGHPRDPGDEEAVLSWTLVFPDTQSALLYLVAAQYRSSAYYSRLFAQEKYRDSVR